MKKFTTVFLAAVMACWAVLGQDFTPTTTWPYVYSEFTTGEVATPDGSTKAGLYNVCLSNGKLHFIDGDMVKESTMVDVYSISIGKDVYVNVGGKVYRVLSKSDASLVVEGIEIDYARLNSTGGAYGSSGNTLSTQALSSLEGIGGSRTNMNHMELRSSKENGKDLSLITRKFLVYNMTLVPATKKDVVAKASDDGYKDDVNAFIKENSIKWNQPASLQVLADYMSSK